MRETPQIRTTCDGACLLRHSSAWTLAGTGAKSRTQADQTWIFEGQTNPPKAEGKDLAVDVI